MGLTKACFYCEGKEPEKGESLMGRVRERISGHKDHDMVVLDGVTGANGELEEESR